MMRTLILAVPFVSIAAFSANAQDAGRFGLEAGVSTLGGYVAPDYGLTDQLRIRTPLYFGGLSDTFDVEGTDIDGDLSVNAAGVMADYYIGESGLRLSGGFSIGGYELNASGADEVELDGTTYTGEFDLSLEQERNIAPVVALGYSRALGGNWGFMVELGARVTGFDLSASGQEDLAPALEDDFNESLRAVNDDLDDALQAVPYVTMGLTLRF